MYHIIIPFEEMVVGLLAAIDRPALASKAAECTVENTWQRIGKLIERFPPQECANYLRNSAPGASLGAQGQSS